MNDLEKLTRLHDTDKKQIKIYFLEELFFKKMKINYCIISSSVFPPLVTILTRLPDWGLSALVAHLYISPDTKSATQSRDN